MNINVTFREEQNNLDMSVKETDIFGVGFGSGGGTTDYTRLRNKPLINGVTLEGDKTAEELGLLDRDEFFGEMELDTSEILAGYTNSAVGQNMTITSSTASVTIAHIIPVTKNGTYTVSIVNSASPAATTYRTSAVCDTRGIILQSMRHTPSAGGTNTITFTAVGDGYLWLTIDVNYVSVSIKGPQMQTDIAELGMVTEFMKSAVHPSSLTDDIFRYEVDDLMSVLKPNNNNMRSISLYRNRIRMYPGPTATNGTMYYSFLVSNTPRYVGGNQASIVSHLTADDFISINIPDRYDLYFTRSRSAISNASGKSAGGFVVATRNTDTGEITVFTKAGGTMPTDATRPVTQIDNVTELLPEIRENGNIAVVFQSREPNVEQTWTFSLDVEQKGLAFDGYTGEAPENNGVASKKYDVGSYLIMHDHLYRVVAPIATGANITVGTNVVQTAIGEELASIVNRTGTLEDEADAAQDDIVELETAVGTKAPAIYSTASGDIASFSDGADDMPMTSVVATITPKQDLHGYDYPWPAGGGVNVGDINIDPFVSAGVTVSAEHSIVTINGTKSGGAYKDIPFDLEVGTYYGKIFVVSGTASSRPDYYILKDGTDIGGSLFNEKQFTVESSSQLIFRCALWTDGAIFTNYKIGVVVSKTSGITAFSPYSNICPISGHTGAIGQNTANAQQWDEEWEVGALSVSDGSLLNVESYMRSKNYIPVASGKTYYKAGLYMSDGRAFFYGQDKSFISHTPIAAAGAFDIPYNACFMKFHKYGASYSNGISINYPSTDTSYHAYQGGTSLSITFPSSAGTVYGGTLDVTNGVLTVTHSIVDMGTLTIGYNTANAVFTMVVPNKKPSTLGVIDYYCETYKCNIPCQSYAGAVSGIQGISLNSNYDALFLVKDTNYTDVEAFKQSVDGHHIVFPLNAPITYQLTEQQLDTLLGSNNIWTDVGTVDVEYPADTKLYIEQLTKPTEDDMTADHAISSGTFFMIGNNLYLATSQIAAGGTITPGTNATQLSLADALNQLNA